MTEVIISMEFHIVILWTMTVGNLVYVVTNVSNDHTMFIFRVEVSMFPRSVGDHLPA
jgi:thiosulfate reductase cytochrome b subunit